VLSALLSDIDGTLTDPTRRINLSAIDAIRSLVDNGIEVVLASGNATCVMDGICRMIGTGGTIIAENGGVFRVGYTGTLTISGDQTVARRALDALQAHYRAKGVEIQLYSPTYRFSDLAFARTVPVDEVKTLLRDHPVQVIDTGYAIHLQAHSVGKGIALVALARAMHRTPADFIAIGDSVNDIDMLKTAGIGVTVANAHPDVKAVAQYVATKEYGDGFVEAIKKYEPYFFARNRSTTI
jgi:phosphoglycolate phosphatase (TIGR01487 family)